MCILLFLEYPLAIPSWQPCFDTNELKTVWLWQRDHVGCGVLLKLSRNASRLFKFGPRSLRIRVRRSFRIRAVTTKFPNPRAWKSPNLTLQFPNPGGGEFPNPGSGEFPNPRAWKFPNPTLKFPNPTLAGNAVSGVFRLTQAPSPNVQPQPQWFKFS